MLGEVHAEGWTKVPGVEVIAVADPLDDRAAKLAAKVGAKAYTDWRQALDLAQADLVSVAVPSGYHRMCAVAALEHGCHVLCEKPLAVSLEDGLAIQAAAEASDRKVGVAFCKRFMGQVEKVTELVQSGALGRPLLYRHVSAIEKRFKLWIMDRQLGGGPFVDMFCHYVDQCRVIFGSDPVRVKAAGMTFSQGAPELPGVDSQIDTGALTVEYASGDILLVSLSWGLARGTAGESLEDLLGPAGVLKIGYDNVTLRSPGGEVAEFPGLDTDMYVRQQQYFADAIRQDLPVKTGVADGLLALRVSLAVLESITTGDTITL